jgi:hypothetical protein
VDESRYSHVEDARKEEDTRIKHLASFKADGRFNATESFQYGVVARLAGLRVFAKGCVD